MKGETVNAEGTGKKAGRGAADAGGRTRSAGADAARRAKLAKIHIAKVQLGMDDSTYRDMLGSFGVESSKEADIQTLNAILFHLESCGFVEKKTVKKGFKKPLKVDENRPESALLGKIEALLADGKLSWAYGHGIAKKMFGIERLDWCDCQQLRNVVAALEYNAKRKKAGEKAE